MSRKLWLASLSLGILAFAMAFAACGDDDDATPTPTADPAQVQEVIDVMTKLASTNGAGATQAEIDFYVGHITDAFLQDFGTPDIATCQADIEICIGEPLPNVTINAEDVEVNGDAATLTMNSDIGSFGVNMIKDDNIWKASNLFVPSDDVGSTDVVDVSLVDFGFDWKKTSAPVTGGDFAIRVKNDGQQTHEVVLLRIDDDRSIDELLQDDTFNPDPIFVKFPFAPGDEATIALPQKLEAGRYAFVCFLPDTTDSEGTPHAFKGMTSEFNVAP